MASAALTQDSLLPQPSGSMAPGALAALVVHLGLIAALSIGTDWRSRQPEVVAAELWAFVPQTAAPAPPPPPVAEAPAPPAPPVAKPPAPADPDIALEQGRRLKAEKLKTEEDLKKAERKKQEAAEAARAAEEKAEDERLARQRQENLRRMMGQAGTPAATPTTGGPGTASQNAGPSADYLARLRRMLREQINFNGTVPGNAPAEVTVITASGGTIISSKLSKSSGHREWDAAVVRALEKLGTLPRDSDGRVPPNLTLVFRQND